MDAAKRLTNAYLYTTKEAGERACHLEKGEYFWYQLFGLEVVDDTGRVLGRVRSIERLAGTDYLVVDTDEGLVAQEKAKSFLIPYIDRYVDRVDLDAKRLFTKGAEAILDAS